MPTLHPSIKAIWIWTTVFYAVLEAFYYQSVINNLNAGLKSNVYESSVTHRYLTRAKHIDHGVVVVDVDDREGHRRRDSLVFNVYIEHVTLHPRALEVLSLKTGT